MAQEDQKGHSSTGAESKAVLSERMPANVQFCSAPPSCTSELFIKSWHFTYSQNGVLQTTATQSACFIWLNIAYSATHWPEEV